MLKAGFEWNGGKVKLLWSFQDMIFSKHNRGMLWYGRSNPNATTATNAIGFMELALPFRCRCLTAMSLLTLSLEDISLESELFVIMVWYFLGSVHFELPPFFLIFPVQEKKLVQEMELQNWNSPAVYPKRIIVFLDCSCLEWYNPFSGYLVLKMENLWQICSEYCVTKMCINEWMFLKTGICDCLCVCDFFNPG